MTHSNETIWWKVSRYRHGVEPVTVLRETKAELVIRQTWIRVSESRVRKQSEAEQYYPTYAEARAACIARDAARVEGLEHQLAGAREVLAQSKALPLTPPETTSAG